MLWKASIIWTWGNTVIYELDFEADMLWIINFFQFCATISGIFCRSFPPRLQPSEKRTAQKRNFIWSNVFVNVKSMSVPPASTSWSKAKWFGLMINHIRNNCANRKLFWWVNNNKEFILKRIIFKKEIEAVGYYLLREVVWKKTLLYLFTICDACVSSLDWTT